MNARIPGTRSGRRVEVKYPPPGLTPEAKAVLADNDARLCELIAEAAMKLVGLGCKPTIPAVVDQVVLDGRMLSIPHANRKIDALKPARLEWEKLHGRQPEWHRSKKSGGFGAKESEIGTIAVGGEAMLEAALALANRRFERSRAELEKACRSRDRLSAENAELREQVRRLELQFIQDG